MTSRCRIRDLNSQGEGVATAEGYTLFIPGALPGEEVSFEITQKKRSFGKAKLLEILQASPERVDPPCPYYPTCGGCQLQHLSYEGQLKMKQSRIKESLKRIGGIDVEVPLPEPSEAFGYRSKLQFSVRDKKIGMLKRGTHDLIDIESCMIHAPDGEDTYHQIRQLLKEIKPKSLRYLILKGSGRCVLLVTKTDEDLKELGEKIYALSPHIQSVVQNINPRDDNVVLGRTYNLLAGEEEIEENLLGIDYSLSPASFFQVNCVQAARLYSHALESSSLTKDQTFVDAYCGVGLLTCLFAKKAKEVIGIECVPQAVENCQNNAQKNSIENARFLCGLAEKVLPTIPKIDSLLLNPPRKGCDPKVLSALAKSPPKEILYISCNPTTLARDLQILLQLPYKIDHVKPFDMFPQTSHVETFVKLSRQT